MASVKKNKSYWLPISQWNLNEVFSTESISPSSFYEVRGFGNPVNRNEEKLEDENFLVLFEKRIPHKVIIEISSDLLDASALQKTKAGYINYYKTIYLQRGNFKIYFNSEVDLQNFKSQQFMLLEVKTINKYDKDHLIVSECKTSETIDVAYQRSFLTEQRDDEPFFDKAVNQIKGLVYGYIIGSIGTLKKDEQDLVSSLTKLKNTMSGVHTNIILSKAYSSVWLADLKNQISKCEKTYATIFNKTSPLFKILAFRLEEIDALNKNRCKKLEEKSKSDYKIEYKRIQDELEKAKVDLYLYEDKNEIKSLKIELEQIKLEEKEKGKSEGKTRVYYKKGSVEYERKQYLKSEIELLEKSDVEYQRLKNNVTLSESELRSFAIEGTEFDSSINEQFYRIIEQLNEISKKTNNFFLSNNKKNDLYDFSFEIDHSALKNHYYENIKDYCDYNIQLPKTLLNEILDDDIKLIAISINAVLSSPQGILGSYSEENILNIIKYIGLNLDDGENKDIMRNYYSYRKGNTDEFSFPTNNDILSCVIIFLMKLQGHEQINKMLITKGLKFKQISFMLYGAYYGFANLPKTFTNIIFENNNIEMQEQIDEYLCTNYLNCRQ